MNNLTKQEHDLAQVLAYHHALYRGNGEVPEFDSHASAEDFSKAVDDVIAKRSKIQLLETGEHFFPASELKDSDGNLLDGASGFFKWSSEDGISYEFSIPSHSFTLPLSDQVWQHEEHSSKLRWLGKTEDHNFTIHLDNECRKLTSNEMVVVCGKARVAKVSIPREHELACSTDTPSENREFISGFRRNWFPATFDLSDSLKLLQSSPPLSNIHSDGFWVLDKQLSEFDSKKSDVVSFLSFLAGQDIQVLWRDVFHGEIVERCYYDCKPQKIAGSPAIPITHLNSNGVTNATKILKQLPTIYSNYCKLGKTLDWNFILGPLQASYECYFEIQLALVFVSIERFGDQFKKYKKCERLVENGASHEELKQAKCKGFAPNNVAGDSKSDLNSSQNDHNQKMFGPRQKMLLKKLKNVAKKFFNDELTSKPVSDKTNLYGILEKRIENIFDVSDPQFLSTAFKTHKVELPFLVESLKKTAREFVENKFEKGAATTQKIICDKISNLSQIPNADSLADVFSATGLELSEDEKKYLKLRNVSLHGGSELEENESNENSEGVYELEQIDMELARIFTLRTLLSKALLKTIQYTGPYYKYIGASPRSIETMT